MTQQILIFFYFLQVFKAISNNYNYAYYIYLLCLNHRVILLKQSE